MEKFSGFFGDVELTKERWAHIIQFHPEVRRCRKYFSETLSKPDVIRKSKFDDTVYIFYRKLPRLFFAVAVKTNKRNFIRTAYLTHKIQQHAL